MPAARRVFSAGSVLFLLTGLLLSQPAQADDFLSAFKPVSPHPVNPQASAEVQRLMQYLTGIYGTRIIAGQYTGVMEELDYLQTFTGKLPALCGFDFLFEGETERALEWAGYGGLVTFSWHWRAPLGGNDFYTSGTSFDIRRAVTPGTPEHDLVLRDIDQIAAQLGRLEEAKVPVLWRPLHEAEGGWFWWGAHGAEPARQLYTILFDRLTSYHRLNNLIWVWTSFSNSQSYRWYPGNQFVDIVGLDNYPAAGNYSPFLAQFNALAALAQEERMAALSENGPIPDPDGLVSQQAAWLYFTTWSGRFLLDEVNNSAAHLQKVYNHDYVLTLDKIPSELIYGRLPLPAPPAKPVEYWNAPPVPAGYAAHEAEEGVMKGTELARSLKRYLGNGYVTGFDQTGDSVEVQIRVRHSGVYRLKVRYASVYGAKRNYVHVNGQSAGEIEFPYSQAFTDLDLGLVHLQVGENTVKIEKSWGYFEVDSVLTAPLLSRETRQRLPR
ncbi:MAG: hypothetical protein EHM61_04710 [Acidobacteria bacterium]|nr:MAG: hypothetical protein EHM61_04710 [Acidobacteriota bacterium]